MIFGDFPRRLPRLSRALLLCIAFAGSTFATNTPPLVNRAAVFDFDGDRRSDYAVVRFELDPAGFKMIWYIYGSATGSQRIQWGDGARDPAPADYDGDGKWDIAVWEPSGGEGSQAYFYILRSSDGTAEIVPWGTASDLGSSQTQDFDGDGKADPTVVRYSSINSNTCNLDWYTLLSGSHQAKVTRFGSCGDRFLRGDFDGDGKADVAVYRVDALQNTFYVQQSSDGRIVSTQFGAGNDDRVVPADFDGDGKTDLCIYRLIGQEVQWYWIESSTGVARGRQFGHFVDGQSGEAPVPGDYDGDGRTDLAVWRSGGEFAGFYVEGSRIGLWHFFWGQGYHENIPSAQVQLR
jgi:hypothetical protein